MMRKLVVGPAGPEYVECDAAEEASITAHWNTSKPTLFKDDMAGLMAALLKKGVISQADIDAEKKVASK